MEHILTNWFNEWLPKEWKTSHNYSWARSVHLGLSSTESNRCSINHCSWNTYIAKNQLANSPQPASTARNYTQKAVFRSGAVLTPLHRRERVRWYNRLRGWIFRSWRRIRFSDESRFLLQKRDGRIRVYRRTFLFLLCSGSGSSVMMWTQMTAKQT